MASGSCPEVTAQAVYTSDKAVCKLQEAAPAQADGISQPEHPAGHTAEEVLPAQRAAPDAPSQPQERPALLLGHAGMLHSQGSLPKQVLQQGHHQLQAQGALDRAPSAGTEPPQRKRPREAQALGPAGAHAEVQPRKRQTRTDLDKQLKSWDDIDLEQLEATSSEEEMEVVPQRGRLRAPPQEVLTTPGAVAASRLETETAWAVMVNAGSSITDEEEDLLPEGASEKIYVQVRNMVLTRWRQDVTQYLTLAQGISAAPPHLHQYASAAWRFLDAAGYINFGLAADITAQRERKRSQLPRGSVIVIGAGLSGLVTARQLQNKGYKVLVLEGHDRPGGRVYTKRLDGHGVSCVADLGGSIITGIDGNPLTVLAKQLRIPLHEINSTDVMLYMAEGLQADQKLDDEVEKKMNQLLDECSRFRDEMGEVSDYITLGTALETIWSGIAGSAAAKRVPSKGRRPSSADPEQPVKVELPSGQPAPADGSRSGSDQHIAQQVVRELVDWAVASERLPDSQVKQEDLPAVQQGGSSSSDSLRPLSQAKQEDLLAPKQEEPAGSSSIQPPMKHEQQQLPTAKQVGSTDCVSVKAPTKAEQQGRLKRRLLDWHMANLEFANATTLHKLSMRSWDQDDPYEVQGSHCFLPGCNLRIVAGLVEGLPVLYDHVVTAVEYSQEGCLVTSGNKHFKADAVVISVPLGVLKKETIVFQPPLPQRKQTAIRQLGFGVLNKVILLFPHVFWGDNVDMFGRVAESTTERGEFFLFYSYAHISGGPCLTALVAGEAAERFEEQGSAESVAKVMAALRTIFAPKRIHVPPPVQAVCTRWGKDPMACGSYSSVGVGSLGGEDYDIMAESVGDRLFFAGEHTTRKYPATMHGAFFTGLREAANVDATLSSRSATLHREERRLAALEASAALAAKRAEVGANQTVDSGLVAELERREPSPQAAENAAKAIELADQLVQLFDDLKHPPDEEFGCCALVKGPAGTPFAGEALVRLDIGAVKGKGGLRRSMPIYLTLRTADAMRLQDLPGGDGARVAFLTSLGVQMVGRHGIVDSQQQLVEAVLQQRHGRRRSPISHAGWRIHAAASQQQHLPPSQLQHRLLSKGAAADGRVQPAGSFRRAGPSMDEPSPASKPQDWSHFYAGR